MRDLYKKTSKGLATVLVALTSCFNANAITVDQLCGTYKFTSSSVAGIAASEQTINIYPGEDDDEIFMNGWLGRSNNVAATFDEATNTITINPYTYIYGKTTVGEEGASISMICLAGVETGNTPSAQEMTLKVADDGTISFDESIGLFAIAGFTPTYAGAYNGGVMTKQAVASVNADNIAGTYSYLPGTVNVNEDYASEDIKTDKFDLYVTKTGDNTFTISNFFNLKDVALDFKFYPECNLLVSDDTNSLYSNSVTLIDGTPIYQMMSLFTSLNFNVSDGKLTTNTSLLIQNKEDEDDYDATNCYAIEGGTATKTATPSGISTARSTSSETYDVYTVEGKLINKNTSLDHINLSKGLYILKTGNKAQKVAY